MNPKVKEKWIAALRSGKYKKGVGVLHIDNKFCCLGVLCDLYIQENNSHLKWEEKDTSSYGVYFLNENSILPWEVKEWAGLDHRNPVLYENSYRMITLADLNDTTGSSFTSIADVIEENL